MTRDAAADIMMDLLVMYGENSEQVGAFIASQLDDPEILTVLDMCIRVKSAFDDGTLMWPIELKGDPTWQNNSQSQ